ncbi:uncharacterized protein N7500_000708 [Penicillium coprophilum]|uniref:uncharacterized protein n=1 Tax=Penicillium coprophilum TaxID=36646 RepID=UPI002385386D|nr:uncharacterized protein N7500_000708 [Penicillium coprophilum]KAJ5178009.1 hypothetical protein N7500_000708 [Penicillium coprophilum]
MSDAENPSANDSEEIKPINFEWTPELVKIGTSRGGIHPSIGPLESKGYFTDCTYRPGMALPDPADTRECLRWAGLSDKSIVEVEQKFNDLYPDYQGPTCGYEEKHYRTGAHDIKFPKVEKMLKLFVQGMFDNKDEFEYTHSESPYYILEVGSLLIKIEGYIEQGIRLGIRLEFAIFCGLHKDDPRAIDDPDLFEKSWFSQGPAGIMSDTLIPFWMQVEDFMASRLVYEGKAWEDGCGTWLIHEGETLEQAQARADEEYEMLTEKAREDEKRERKEEREKWARLEAEEEAMLVEQERLEDEMLKQQSIEKAAQPKDGEDIE